MIERISVNDEWLTLLRGSFAFETAPFGVHPNDKLRAERMFYLATRAGVSEAEIVDAAEQYLRDECNASSELIVEELNRVNAFLSRHKFSGRAERAWLVFWNSSESPVYNATSNLVQVLDPRMSAIRICDFLEFHYRAVEYTPRELLHYSTRSKKNPCRSRDNSAEDKRGTSYICGHNPWLEARFCSEIAVLEIEGEGSKVSWLA